MQQALICLSFTYHAALKIQNTFSIWTGPTDPLHETLGYLTFCCKFGKHLYTYICITLLLLVFALILLLPANTFFTFIVAFIGEQQDG